MAEHPLARSPITPAEPRGVVGGWEVSRRRSDAALRLSDLSALTKIVVRAEEPPFDVSYGRAVSSPPPAQGWLVAGSGPGEWTLIGPPGATLGVATSGFATTIDLTHGRALMRLIGESAPSVLEKVCAVDLSERMCPDGAAFRAPVASVVTDVVRHDEDGVRSYLLHCERSTGQYLFDALLDAGEELGIDVEGFPPILAW